MNPQEAHVFFVDDDPHIRAVVQRTLESVGMHASVFASAQDCLNGLSQQPCNVLITDLRMNGMNGVSLIQEFKHRLPRVAAIIVTAYGDIPSAVAATKAGAADYLEKPLDRQELLSAIQRAMDSAVGPRPSVKVGLSDAETRILRHILDGKTNREIACNSSRSIRTIEAHRRTIMHKLGVKNFAQLIQRAVAFGYDKDDRTGYTPAPPQGH
ncbi:MAG: response regulator [Sedimentisphaerales bacterium]|nr:response regulator [Sedimentisphaerales bacterium]